MLKLCFYFLIAKMPVETTVKKTEKGFPVSDDGRLIITEEDDTASKSKGNIFISFSLCSFFKKFLLHI